MSELETAIIKNAISREKNLLIKVLRFIDVWFLMGIKKAIYKALKTHIKLERLTVFCQQLASMLQAGLPLSHALDTIVAEIDDKLFKFILIQIKEGIFAGSSFTDSLKQFPNAFPPLVYSMIEAGEVSGSLPDANQSRQRQRPGMCGRIG